MFALGIERSQRVLLLRFIGVFTSEDLEQQDKAVHNIVDQEGAMPAIIDWSEVDLFAIPQTRMAERGRLIQIALGQLRVMVVSRPDMCEVVRVYTSQQRDFGNVEPTIVRSRFEAYRALGLKSPHFEPLAGQW